MSSATITNPTGRNTKAYVVTIGGNQYFFSYETCIAFAGNAKHSDEHGGGVEYIQVRLKNHWGPTTGRHFNELGCKDFPEVDNALFAKIVDNAVPVNLAKEFLK